MPSANNIGMRAATGRYVVLLNNDIKADEHFLEELVRAAESDEKIGMAAPKILNFYEPQRIDSVGGLLLCADGIGRGRGRGELDQGQYDGLREGLLPSGCAALYRKEMLDEVGLLPEEFFAYCEDSDLGLRGLLGRLAHGRGAAGRDLSQIFRHQRPLFSVQNAAGRAEPLFSGAAQFSLAAAV